MEETQAVEEAGEKDPTQGAGTPEKAPLFLPTLKVDSPINPYQWYPLLISMIAMRILNMRLLVLKA